MIVVTGGAGFIGSVLLWQLNELGEGRIVVVDELGTDNKWLNIRKRSFLEYCHKDTFLQWLQERPRKIDAIFHLGACSSTTEHDADFLMDNNTRYSMELFRYCADHDVPFIYASSAATYGDGEQGYSDSRESIGRLLPINKYGFSKHVFDLWALRQTKAPPFWAGLKFFNVYGPQEYHKGGQASVVYHAYPQVTKSKKLKLFKSYREGIAHGEQKRDFVYVKDAVKVMLHLYQNRKEAQSSIYNLGTGVARSFADLGKAVFAASGGSKPNFDWIEMPDNIKNQYQYFTEATLEHLREAGQYKEAFTSLEDGIADYVESYLAQKDPYL